MSSIMKNYRDDQRRKRDRLQTPRKVVSTMTVSADSRDELDETIAAHVADGWRETGRKSDRDGTFHATLTK